MIEYALAIGLIFVVNLLPAFGPPTWAVLVFLQINSGLEVVPLVLLGALAAASGRLLLAHAARKLRGRFSHRRKSNLKALEDALVGSRGKAVAGLGLFALSPVPSAQLFVAAGLLKVPLLPLTAAFFSGRLVSYSIYTGAASLAEQSLEAVFTDSLTSPVGVALQLAMVALLVLLVKLDWARILARHGHRGPPRTALSP